MIEIGWICQTRRQLYYYWRCCQHLSPFHPIPYHICFRFFHSISCTKNPNVIFQCWINRIYLYSFNEKQTLCQHCACLSSPKIPVSPAPCSLYCQKLRRRRMKKLFLWTFVRHFKWCICCNEINLLRNWMVKWIEVKGLFFKCELDNMFLYA